MADEPSSTQHIEEQGATLMERVFALVRACPPGRVTTYGWLGKAVGYHRGARMIGWFMNESPEGVPAQRVINSKGELSGSWAFGQRGKMRKLLEDEGIVFSADERVDLKRYGWDPSQELTEEEREQIFAEAASTGDDISPSPRLVHMLENDKASPFRDVRGGE